MIKHPPNEKDIDLTLYQYPILYTDFYMKYTIGEVVTYWSDKLLKNGIILDKIICDENGFDGLFFRPYYKTFPWSVSIIHMDSLNPQRCIYKINFNLPYNYLLSEKQKTFINEYFKGYWIDYIDIQLSRIIIQFNLNEYSSHLFRTLKIQKIKDNLQKM